MPAEWVELSCSLLAAAISLDVFPADGHARGTSTELGTAAAAGGPRVCGAAEQQFDTLASGRTSVSVCRLQLHTVARWCHCRQVS